MNIYGNKMLMRNDASGVKSRRIKEISKMVCGIEESQLARTLSFIEFKWGLSRPTALRYLRILEDLNFILIDSQADLIKRVAIE